MAKWRSFAGGKPVPRVDRKTDAYFVEKWEGWVPVRLGLSVRGHWRRGVGEVHEVDEAAVPGRGHRVHLSGPPPAAAGARKAAST